MDLDELLQKVNSKESFLQFVNILRDDKKDENLKEIVNSPSLYNAGLNGWENSTIIDFLESIERYGKDSEINNPSWKNFALLLYSGKFYE